MNALLFRAVLFVLILIVSQAASAAQKQKEQRPSCLGVITTNVHNNIPARSGIGRGNAKVLFHINNGGKISVDSANGSTPRHSALARQIIAKSRGPKNCGVVWMVQDFAFD